MVNESIRRITELVFEVGRLKRLPRSGWLLAGVKDCESVAEHCFRTAVLGFILAALEGLDAYRVATLCLMHDLTETRLGDLDALAKRYLDRSSAVESTVMRAQLEGLPKALRDEIVAAMGSSSELRSEERNIVADADRLECFIQALEYRASGVEGVAPFLALSEDDLASTSARTLLVAFRNEDPAAWWSRSR